MDLVGLACAGVPSPGKVGSSGQLHEGPEAGGTRSRAVSLALVAVVKPISRSLDRHARRFAGDPGVSRFQSTRGFRGMSGDLEERAKIERDQQDWKGREQV
jgi:hypothetical protein